MTSIGNGAFGYCRSLASLTIPDSVTSFGRDFVSNCENLTTIHVPATISEQSLTQLSEALSSEMRDKVKIIRHSMNIGKLVSGFDDPAFTQESQDKALKAGRMLTNFFSEQGVRPKNA